MLTADVYRELIRTALRYTRGRDQAADLAHDVVVEAIGHGVSDWEDDRRRAWLRGAVRNHAAFVARTAVRRRAREAVAAEERLSSTERRTWTPAFLESLPPSLRRLAKLMTAELSRSELAYLLRVSDTALRQRLTALRRAVQSSPRDATQPVGATSGQAIGPLRTALLDAVSRSGGMAVGTHDPDGHFLIFTEKVPHVSVPGGNQAPKEK
ncbi:MAG: sigma-70 family RNA polymerase sigma factor [Labilithrix sp.]|nr:sigma-70 family RNA polymerase sigma factor [Labilithrix sp.]